MFAFSSALIVLSVLIVSCDAFRAPHFTASRSSKLHSNLQPTTSQENWKQSLKGLINLGVTGSTFFGLTAAALAAEAAKGQAPVVSTATPGSTGPVVDSEGFTVSDSGLKSRDTKVGDGDSPIAGDTVKVHYTGWLDEFETGRVFDSSYDRRSPLVFKVGVKQVIAGWDEALLSGMKIGGKKQVIIPPALGYGARGAGGVIPPNATLYFNMELVGITARVPRAKLIE